MFSFGHNIVSLYVIICNDIELIIMRCLASTLNITPMNNFTEQTEK